MSAFEAVDGGFADMPWSVEIGFTDTERDDVRHGLNNLEKVTDTGFRDITDVMSDEGLHGERGGKICFGGGYGETTRRCGAWSRTRTTSFSL